MTDNVSTSSVWNQLGDALHPTAVLAATIILAVIVLWGLAFVVLALARKALGAGAEFEGEIVSRFVAMRIRLGAAPGAAEQSGANTRRDASSTRRGQRRDLTNERPP